MNLIQAISEGYLFLSEAILHGMAAWMLPILYSTPDDVQPKAIGLQTGHHRVFSMEVHPYASVFLSEVGLMGGSECEANAAFYQRIHWTPPAEKPVDHLAVQLAALGWLAGAEWDAVTDQQPAHVTRIQALRRQFLDERVLTWLPAVALACIAQSSSVYTDVMRLTLELVATDRAALGDELMLSTHPPFFLPSPPDILADPKTGLGDIAFYLMTPALSGVFLSWGNLLEIARRHRLPSGFTDRITLLHNLLRNAANYGLFVPFVNDLYVFVAGRVADLRDLAQKHPALATGCLVWAEQAEITLMILKQMQSAVFADD